MTGRALYLKFVVALASLLVTMQALSLAHSAEHADHDHEHAGITCNLDLVVGQSDIDLPAPPQTQHPKRACLAAPSAGFSSPSPRSHVNCGPPVRAPPAPSQAI